MLSFWCALAVAVLCALNTIIFKNSMQSKCSEWAILLFFNAAGFIICSFVMPLPSLDQLNSHFYILLAGNGALFVLIGLCEMKAYRHLDASFSQVFGTLNVVLAALAGIVIFNESLSFFEFVGIALIAFATFVTANLKACRFNKGIYYKLASAGLYCIALTIDKYMAMHLTKSTIMFFGYLVPALLFILLDPRATREIMPAIRRSSFTVLLAPVFSVARLYFFLLALSLGDLAVTFAVAQTAIIFVFIFEILILRKTQHLLQKGAACSICLLGAIMLGC